MIGKVTCRSARRSVYHFYQISVLDTVIVWSKIHSVYRVLCIRRTDVSIYTFQSIEIKWRTKKIQNKTLANWIQLIVNSTVLIINSMAIYSVYVCESLLLLENRNSPVWVISSNQTHKIHTYNCVVYSFCGSHYYAFKTVFICIWLIFWIFKLQNYEIPNKLNI